MNQPAIDLRNGNCAITPQVCNQAKVSCTGPASPGTRPIVGTELNMPRITQAQQSKLGQPDPRLFSL